MSRGTMSLIGGIFYILGLAGMAEAAEDHGSMLVAVIVFAIGFILTTFTYFMRRGERITWKTNSQKSRN